VFAVQHSAEGQPLRRANIFLLPSGWEQHYKSHVKFLVQRTDVIVIWRSVVLGCTCSGENGADRVHSL
jgi:hypothetical protein